MLKLLLKFSVQELHNSMLIPSEEVVLKEARYEDNNIIISDSTLQNILPTQLKYMTSRYKVMCGCECCISAKIMHSSLLSWRKNFLNPNTKAVMQKTEGLVQWLLFD